MAQISNSSYDEHQSGQQAFEISIKEVINAIRSGLIAIYFPERHTEFLGNFFPVHDRIFWGKFFAIAESTKFYHYQSRPGHLSS